MSQNKKKVTPKSKQGVQKLKKLNVPKANLPSWESLQANWESRLANSSPALVSVKWLDACMDGSSTHYLEPGWDKNHRAGVLMETIGFLLNQTKDWVTIAMERHAGVDNGFRRLQDIPSYSVCELVVLREQKK